MNFKILATLVAVVLALAIGQLLFKATAIAWSMERTLFSLRVMVKLLPSLAVYGFATLAWIWILQSVPLKTAYPFMALAFAIVPVGAYFIYGEAISSTYWMGSLFIMVGVVITALAK